jgi:acetyltransferase
MTNPDKKTCEFAIVVYDKWQGKGIARLLMNKLIDIARNRSLEVMEGQVLANNYRMLELMTSLNFRISNDPNDNGIKVVRTNLS